MNQSIILCVIMLFLSTSCSDDKKNSSLPKPLDAVEYLDVQYEENDLQTFDIYLPENRSVATAKVIVLIHGGGWISGDKSDLSGVYEYLKSNTNEYAIVNMNYTLGEFTTSPIARQINDIISLLGFLKDNAQTYVIAPEFAFVGISAGAHLAMLYSYKYDLNRDVKVVCNMVGPTNFLDSSYLDSTEPETIDFINNVQAIFGLPIDENADYYESVSPYFWVNEHSPATISFYGGQDVLVPEEQGILIKDALDMNKVVNDLILYEDGGHGWGPEDFLDTLQRIEIFIISNFE